LLTVEDVAALLQVSTRTVRRLIDGGREPYNLKFSLKRSEAVQGYLVQAIGPDLKRADVIGFAAKRPVAPNTKPDGSDDPDGRQLNRRVEVILTRCSVPRGGGLGFF
jgi:flagellar motor protein MotB